MTHRLKSVFKILFLVFLVAVVAFALIGCTVREGDDVIVNPPSTDSYSPINNEEAKIHVQSAISNRKKLLAAEANGVTEEEQKSEDWFVLDLSLDFEYIDRTNGYEEVSKFTLILKANWNTVDSNKSELYFRVIDPESLVTVIGVYYLEKTMYVSLMDGIAGYEDMNYRFSEVNFTTIASLLAPLLKGIGLDPVTVLMAVCSGSAQKEISALLTNLGVDLGGAGSILGAIDTLLYPILFDSDKGRSIYALSADGNTETVGFRVNVNNILNLVNDLGVIGGFVGINEISWDAFGLPDFDPIMQQFLGFSIAKIRDNNWPKMSNSFLKAINVKKNIDGQDVFALEGMEIAIACDGTETYPDGQYETTIRISPFFLGTKKKKTDISFSGLDLSENSTKYREGGLLNLEAQLALEFTAPENTALTVGEIVGRTLDGLLPNNDLTSLKKLPINFNGFNYVDPETGEKMTRYRFDLEIKTDLDLFNGENNAAEINLYAQDEKILSVYLVGTTIYVYTENMKGASFSIPNISIPNIDLTELLFGANGALGVVMPYLDPNYQPAETPSNGASGGEIANPPQNAGIDAMELLKQLITYKSYYNWKGEKIENAEGNITLPGKEDAPLIFELDNYALNDLLYLFLDSADLGIESVRLETMLSHPQDSTKLSVTLPHDVKLQILVTKLAWLGRPDFDFSNVENAEYAEVGGDANFYAELGGEFELGIEKTDDAARVVLNLSDLIQTLTQNIFLDLGLNVSDTATTKIRYLIKANFDMKMKNTLENVSYMSFRDTSFALYLFAGDSDKNFLMLYYNGTDDMLYIDLSRLTVLQETIPLFKIFKPVQPSLKIKLGLESLLENRPQTLGLGVNADENVSNTDFLMNYLTGTGISFGNAEGGALDAVDLVGKLLEGIYVQDDTLSIIASKQMLSVLLTVLGVQLGEGTELPGTNIFGNLNIMNPDPEKGFLELHLGLVGEEGKGTEFLKLDLRLLNRIDVSGNPDNFEIVDSSFNPENFENLYNVMEKLVVAFELGGRLQLEPMREGGFSLGELLAKLIGAKYVDPWVDTVQISSDLEFTLKANIDISGLNIPEDGSLQFDPTTLLNSELALEIRDRKNGAQILGIYYKGGDLYLDLHYFLQNNGYIRLQNAGDFIYNLISGTKLNTGKRTYASESGGVRFETNAVDGLNSVRLGILATISPYGLTISIAEGALSNLLGGLLGVDSDTMIQFGEVNVGLDLSEGIDLSFSTSIEDALSISLSLGDLSLSANPNDKVIVSVPQGVDWVQSDMSELLTSVLVKLELSLGVGGKGRIDLSPLISSLLSDSNDPNASKIDINVLIENLGLEGAELNAVVAADLNFQAIAQSHFRIDLYKGAVSAGDVFLTAIYNGAENKLYLKTQLFGISNDKEEFKELDIDKLMGAFMQKALKDVSEGENAVEVRNSPFFGLFGADGDPDPMRQFVQIIFAEGGIQLKVAEEALIFLFQSLGVDASQFFDEFDLDVEGELSINPLSIFLSAKLNGDAFTFEMALKNLSVAFGGEIDTADLKEAQANGKVTKIESFTSVGVGISGSLGATVSSGTQSGEIYFNELIKNILGEVQIPAGIDGATLSTLGLLIKVIGNNSAAYPAFGGTLYYDVGGVINIAKIENLYLTLKLGTTPGGNDVLDVIVRGSAEAGSTGVDIYVNAEKLLGIKPFVIKNVAKFIDTFVSAGVNAKGQNANGIEMPQLNRSGNVKNLFAGLTMQKEGTDGALANAIVLYLASNYEEFGLKAPIVLDVGAGALYGILASLAGIDLGSYLEGHDVFAQMTAGGSEALISLDLGLQGLISVGIDLKTPTLNLQPIVPEAPVGGYTVLDETFTTLRVTLKGHASLKGNFDPDTDPNAPVNPNTINLANIIGNFLTGVNFDILVNLIDDVDKTLKYSVDVAVNLKKLIAGDWSGLNGKVEFFDRSDNLLIGAYYLDGNLFLDLEALNIGKIRIDNFAVFLGKMIGTSPSAASAEALSALPSDPVKRDAALNEAAMAAYINILLGNDTGIVLEVTADAIALVLSAISVGDTTIDGNAIKDVFHGILELKLGLFHYDEDSDSVHILGLQVNVASYSAELAFDSAHIDFENTDVRPDDFTNWQSNFGSVGELSEWIYIKTALTFGWHLSEGMSVDFTDILGTFLASKLDMLSISPVLKILNEFGQDFKLEVEGKIHFGNLMRDGTLLPDLLGKNGFNAEVLMDSELSIKLIATTGDQDREVISFQYTGNTLYVDLSAFSIGKVRIPDAYNFFLGMFAPGENPAALAYALPYSTDATANANNSADDIAKQIGVLGAFINLNVSSSSVALHVGTAGLFAILNLVGLDLSGAGLTLDGLYDMINPLGDLNVSVWLAQKDKLLELALSLTEWTKDNEGNIIEPSDREIALKLGLDSDFKIVLGDNKIPQHVVVIADPDSYDRLSDDALISVATRLEFHINLKEGTVDNIYKDPLESLIGSLLTQIALSIGVQILDDQSGTVTLSVSAEVPIMTVVAGLTAGGFDLSAINAKIEVLYSNTGARADEKCYATLILNNGDLFADLSLLGGPKAMIKDMAGLFANGFSAPRGAAADSGAANAAADEDEQLLPKLPISLELMKDGFFITVKKAAFNAIFGLINVNGKNLGDWEITDDVVVKLGLSGTDNPIYGADGQSFKLGAELAFVQGEKDILALGIDLNGIGAKFSRFGISRPDASEYANIKDVDTILAKTSLEFNLRVNDGQQVDLKKTVEALLSALGVQNPLGIPIAPQIKTQAILEDTLRLDLEVAVNINAFASGQIADILKGINVRASLYSIGRPDFFKIDIAFDDSTAYIDATTVGLGKIKLPVNSLMERILGGSSPAAKAAAESLYGYGGAMAAPMSDQSAEARKMLAATNLMFGKNGITAIVAYDTIGTVLQMLGIPISDYLDGVIAPSVEINITERFGFNIIGHILTGNGANGADDEIARLGLSLVGQSTNVDVKVSSVQEIESFVPEDAEAYTSYDELMLTLEINASISLEFLEGYIPLDQVLDLLISNMKMGIDIGETHQIAFALNGKVGIDLKKFLEKSSASFFGELSLDYIITSDGGSTVYDQSIAKIFIVEEGIFVELKLQDIGLDLKVQIPDLNLPSIIWNLIDGKDPFASGSDGLRQVNTDTSREVPYLAPLATLLQAKAAGTEAEYALPIVIALNSQELNVEISTLLLASILPILGLQLEDPQNLVESILSSGKLAISVDPTFRIYFRLQKDPGGDPYIDKDGNARPRGGYAFELSLFHNTVISTDAERYYQFASRFTSVYENDGYAMVTAPEFGDKLFTEFAETFLPFNLKKLITSGEFDVIEDFISTLGGKVELELGVDFKQLVFDLSALFQNEENAYFYIQIADALKSAVKIVVEFDASLKGIVKDATLGVDAILSFENEYGDNLLTVMIRGGGSGVMSPYEDGTYPAIYLYSEAIGIPKLKVNSPVLKDFAHLDLNALLKSLGLNVGEGNAASRANAAPQNGILDNSDEGFLLGGINIANLLDSVSVNPGKLSIVLAKTIVKDILGALLNFPFDEIEDISATIADGVYLNVELQKGFALKMNLPTLEVNLGGRAVFGSTKAEVQKTFDGFTSLSEYKWSFELESELTITDDLVSVFSLSKMTTPLIGADVTIEAGEVLGTKLTFYLKGFIDFSDMSNLSLQLAMVSGGKQYINIMYVGNAANPQNSWVYIDLTGLGLTSLKLNLDLGGIVKNLLGSLTASSEEGSGAAREIVKAVSNGAADAMRPADENETSGGDAILTYNDINWGLADGGTLEDVPFGSQLLLLAIGSKNVSVAITGALLTSLIHGLTDAFILPEINYIRLGYVEGKMTGIELVLNEENFRIAYSFTENSASEIGRDTKNPIDPTKSATGETLTYSMSDIGVIQQVFLALNMEIRINTRNADGKKSTQIEGLEAFMESLIGVPDGTVDFAPQDASMIISFQLQLALNLADLKKTQLALTISYGDADLIGVYFDNGSVYADLSGLGLFEVKISGLDIISLILNLLGDTLDLEGGLKVGDLINGILPAPAAASGGTGASSGTYANALRNASGVTKLPKIRVVLTNDSLYIIPSMSSIGAIVEKLTKKPLGFDLPEFAELRLGINLKDGLNNLSLKLKLDNYNNGVDISIPSDGGLALKLNDPSQSVTMPNNFSNYGGISGLSLSNGGISLNTLSLVSSILDSIDAPNNLGIYIKKRNSYFINTTTDSYKQPGRYPVKNPLQNPVDDNGYYSTNDYRASRQTSASVVFRRDQASNYLELSVATNGNAIKVRYNACKLIILIQDLNIKILGSNLLGKLVASILKTFVSDGIAINLNILDLLAGSMSPEPIIGSVGMVMGTVTDETGEPVKDATVTLKRDNSVRTAVTDSYGNYAFTGIPAGTYSFGFTKDGFYEVLRESVDVKELQTTGKAQTFDVQMFQIGSTTGIFTQVGFNGKVTVKGSDPSAPIAGAQVYIDNKRIGDTNASGNYSVLFDAVSGSRHTIIVKAENYQETEVTVEVAENGKFIETNFELTPIEASKGVIHGKFVEKVKQKDGSYAYSPVSSGMEIWLKKKGGGTIIESSTMTPYDYLGWKDGVRLGTISSDGSFTIPNLDYGTYYLKLRSTVFKNVDLYDYEVTVTAQNPSYVFEGRSVEKPTGEETDRVFNGQIVVERRPTDHFSQNTVTNTTVAGIRIRFGADQLDGDGNSANAGDTIGNKFETGDTDTTDSVSYIEAWLGENLVTGLFDTVHNLISSGLAGITPDVPIATGFADTGADARVTPLTLLKTGNTYNEDDITVYDFRFGGRAEYLQYETAFMAKMSSALLRNILASVLGGAFSSLPGLLQNMLFGALNSTFGSVGEILGTIFPFTVPYSFAENKDLPGNPLEQYNKNGWLTEGTTPADGRGTPALTRKVNYAERSVYARIKLNQNNQGGLLESIKLFVNGAAYGHIESNGAVNGGNFTLKYKDYLDKAPVQTVSGGVTNAENRATIDEWLRKNTVNDYIVIEDYATDINGEQYIYNQYYIRNIESDPTLDDYFELDIINTGLYLKSAKTLGTYCNLNSDGSYGEQINLPEKVIFNNPYDLSDFTVIGGTWAAAAGGIRSNTDKTRTVTEIKEILPTRNKATFQAGGSDGSAGVGVSWNLSLVDLDPKGGNYEIIGSILNIEVRIPCEVKERTIDKNDILSILKGDANADPIPAIDPYNYNESDYIDSLPKYFREGIQVVTRSDNTGNPEAQIGKYVFDQLSWDMSDVVISNEGSSAEKPQYIKLTYGFKGSGKGTVDVPVTVLNRTITGVSAAVSGSYQDAGISGSEVVFDPFEIDADDARQSLRDLVKTTARLTTVSGAVDTLITAVDLGTFRYVNFSRLDYGKDGVAKYTVYLTFVNSEGDRTRVPVTVRILDKRIDGSSLGTLSVAERTIKPFRKSGMYDKDIGLNNLPQSVTVYYKDGSANTLVRGTDYVWGLDLGNRVVLEGKNANGVDNWRGLMSSRGGTYRFRIFGTDGSNRYADDIYGMDLIVEPTLFTSAETVTFQPYDEIRLPNEIAVGVGGSEPNGENIVNVRWMDLSDEKISPNFAGSIQYSDLEVYDALFDSVTLYGAKVVVRQTNAEALVFPDQDGRPYEINPYLAAAQIEKLLQDERTYFTVDGAPGVKVTKDLYEVVSYRITDATLTRVRVRIKIGNKGYADGTKVWSQEIVMPLNTVNMTNAVVRPIDLNSVFDGLPSEIVVELNGQSFSVPVSYRYEEMTTKFKTASGETATGTNKEFYKAFESDIPFVPKNLPSVRQTLKVTVSANEEKPNEVNEYTLNGAWNGADTVYAFDPIPMPSTGTLIMENSGIQTLPVVWDRVENYQNATGTLIFHGRIGAKEYGYYDVVYRVDIVRDKIGMTDMPEVIQIDPLKDIREQLAPYAAVSANNESGAVVLNTEFPIGDIDLNWQGTDEISYLVKFGRRLTLTSGDVFVYEEKPVAIKVLRREAARIEGEFIGNVYKEIDFASIKEVTVVFESGEIMTSKIAPENWSGIESVNYSKANVYTVQLSVFADNPNLAQTVDVRVTVRSAVLTAAYRTYENGRLFGKVNGLIGEKDENGNDAFMTVDPFEGFDPNLMPDKLWGQFEGFDEPILLSADWSYAHIVNAMSVSGGEFTVSEHNAGRVTLYLDDNGERIRPQQLSFEVKVTESLVQNVQFSKDANASENSQYENLMSDSEANNDKLPTDRAVYYKLFLNPYELTSYNENPMASDFSYYRAMKVALSNGRYLYFNLENTEYQIYDANTLMPTSANDLYKGRDVVVRMIANRENLRVDGKQVLASDAIVTAQINVRIYDMTYTGGGQIPPDYTVDLYKEYFKYEGLSNVLTIGELREDIKDIEEHVTIYGTDTVYGSEQTPVSAEFDGVKVGTGRLNVNYNGETGYLDYTFGNEVGGIQTVSVPVRFVKRVLNEVFDKNATEHYYTLVGGKLHTMGQEDSTMKLDSKYTKNFTEGFLYDPFANYTAKDFLKPATTNATFISDTGETVKVQKSLPITWETGKLYIDLNGGDFTVTAKIRVMDGANAIEQTAKFRYRVLKRKAIYATNADDPKGNNLKGLLSEEAKNGIRAYDYLGYDDVDAEVGKRVFVPGAPAFTVEFTEGCDIEYNLGVNAGTVQIADAMLIPEGTMNMSFHIDSLKPLNSRGQDVRFELTIPGYGLGAIGQQSVYLYVKSEKQEIVSVKTWLTETRDEKDAQPFINYFRRRMDGNTGSTIIEALNESANATKVVNPYYFINRGGLELPSALLVTVQNEEGVTSNYTVEGVNWTGARSNFYTVPYTGGSFKPSFTMPVDNQAYSFELQADAMLFEGTNGIMFDTTSTPYAADEIILLPMNNDLAGSAKTTVADNGNPIYDSNYVAGAGYGYNVTFSNGLRVTFTGINGGGNYRNNYNRWDFTAVDFGDTANVQYAQMTLGGRGGETVKWAIRISDKSLVGTSMQTVQLTAAGASAGANVSFDFTRNGMGELGGDANGRLPDRFYQYYNKDGRSSGIPVTYGELLSDTLGSSITSSGDNVTNFTYNSATRTIGIVSKNTATAAPIYIETPGAGGTDTGEKPASKAAAIKWTATGYRAYPSPSTEVSGYLTFAMYPYMQTLSNKTVDAYFRNPDNSIYSYNQLAPRAESNGWIYPSGLSVDSDSSGDRYVIPQFATGTAVAQNEVPIYQVKKGTPFDVGSLPLFTLGNSVYYVPWELSNVYYTNKTNADYSWVYDNTTIAIPPVSSQMPQGSIFSCINGRYNATQSGGILAIDTSIVGARYTLVLNIPNASSANGNFQLIVAIDVVD